MISFKVFSYIDKTGVYANSVSQVQKLLDAMSVFFSDRIVGDATIALAVTATDSLGGAVAAAGAGFSTEGIDQAATVVRNIPTRKILEGFQYARSDGILQLSPTFMRNLEEWVKSPSSPGALDALTVIKHELLHVMGFSGMLDETTGKSDGAFPFISVFDSQVVTDGTRVHFDGAFSKIVHGSALMLRPLNAINSIYHIDDDTLGQDDLMGWTYETGGHGQQDLSAMDYSVLKDLGYTLKTTLVSSDSRKYIPGAGTKVNGTSATDIAYFAGKAADYTIAHGADGSLTVKSIANAEITSTLGSIERIQFSDTTLAYDGSTSGGAGEIYRLYQAAFNRKPDAVGLGFWIKARDGGTSLDAIAGSFIGSTEFKTLYGANISNDQYVTQLYSNVLHRAPDSTGKAFWVKALEGGTTRAHVLAQFSESQENKLAVMLDANSNEAKAYRLYQAAFDRTPDSSGLSFWASDMNTNGRELTAVAKAFIGSDEFKAKYGANLSDSQFVTQLYANVLHRAPDAAGKQFWETAISTGATREHVLAQFSESPENRAQIVGVWQDGFEYTPYLA